MSAGENSQTLDALIVHEMDTVAVALKNLSAGSTVHTRGQAIILCDDISQGHKFAYAAHIHGDNVIKFGCPIGRATQNIEVGEHVHTHNLKTGLSGVETYAYTHQSHQSHAHETTPNLQKTFQGYRRASGAVGTRNEIWVIASVGCVANVCQKLARASHEKRGADVDGIFAITHPYGCSQLGEDHLATRRILAALAGNPNVGGVLFVGLGCETNQIKALLENAPNLDMERVKFIISQDEDDEFAAGMKAISALVELAKNDSRETCDLSDLVVGLKCGGSDGLSGLTANPLVGDIADIVTGAGGSAVLSEIPEMFGAEQGLMNRSVSQPVFEAFANCVNDFKQYFIDHNQPIYENPSPGNKDGGITTLEEKSLGAVQKGGACPVVDVLSYGESIRTKGLSVLEAPGNDAVSSTALAASGANLILFTTGRGTPLGFPVPTLKIATNSALATRKTNWIDFDAGPLAIGTSRQDMRERLLDCVLKIASGTCAKNEENDERSIAIWKRGVTL
ncbi:MAG: altronate hydrolase [Robiginitomaculum sp.]|nr:MAG: altronate hydrolase [Robiginitomaculum sp.]